MARSDSVPFAITVDTPSVPYPVPGYGGKREIAWPPGTENAFAIDIRPAYASRFQWAFGGFAVLCGGTFSADATERGAWYQFGAGGHKAPEIWGFFSFDFTTGRWTPYVNGKDRLGTEAPRSVKPWNDWRDRDFPASEWVIGIASDPSIANPLEDLHMIGDGVTVNRSTGTFNPLGEWWEMPPPDHTYTQNWIPPRAKNGGRLEGIRTLTAAATSDSVIGSSRSFQIQLEGADAGRWSFASVNRGIDVGIPPRKTFTETHTVYDEVANRLISNYGIMETRRIYYLDLEERTWKRITAANNLDDLGEPKAPRTVFFDNERNLYVQLTGATKNIYYMEMSAPTPTWVRATKTPESVFPPGDTELYPDDPPGSGAFAPGVSYFKGRFYKYPLADGGDDCWYGFWGRPLREPVNDKEPAMYKSKAADQRIWRIRIPAALTDPWTIEGVTVTDEDGTGGLTAQVDPDWRASQAHHYTRFFYVPSIRCFAWIPRHDSPVELVKPVPWAR